MCVFIYETLSNQVCFKRNMQIVSVVSTGPLSSAPQSEIDQSDHDTRIMTSWLVGTMKVLSCCHIQHSGFLFFCFFFFVFDNLRTKI